MTERFRATHAVALPDGQLEPLHEHDWRVTIMLSGTELDEQGLLVDFAAVRERLRAALDPLRERNLNEVEAFQGRSPTAEHVAAHLAARLSGREPRRAAGGGVERPGARLAGADPAQVRLDGVESPGVRLGWLEVEEEVGCVVRYHVPGGWGPMGWERGNAET